MSTLAIILTAAMVVPADMREKVSGEIQQARLCLNGNWEGTWRRYGRQTGKLRLNGDGELTRIFGFDGLEDSFKAVDVGDRKLRIKWIGDLLRPSGDYLGIYRHEGNNVIMCVRPANRGYPTSFKAQDDGEWLFILHRVKPSK
jgi:hypothetical protein